MILHERKYQETVLCLELGTTGLLYSYQIE